MKIQLSENLRTLMFEKNIKAVDLSRATNVPQATLHRMLSGESKNPHKSSLKPIAEFFSVTIDQLLGKSSLGFQGQSKKKTTDPNMVPILDSTNLLRGDCMSDEHTSFSAAEQNASDKCFAMKLEDNSMGPIFPQGTIIVLDPSKNISDGCYAVYLDENTSSANFRQVVSDGDDFFLRPLSPDIMKYKIQKVTDNTKCCGILVQAKINF